MKLQHFQINQCAPSPFTFTWSVWHALHSLSPIRQLSFHDVPTGWSNRTHRTVYLYPVGTAYHFARLLP